MKLVAILLLFVSISSAQDDDIKDTLDKIFTKGPNAVQSTPSPGGTPSEGGDGFGSGNCLCVPYYSCDPNTKTIITTGETDGFGIIDIRFGGKNKCEHFLDVCCNAASPATGPTDPQVPPPSPGPDPGLEKPYPPVTPPPVTPPPTLPPQEVKCGMRNPRGVEFQITGNKNREAEFGEFPWMVALLKKVPNGPENMICGASLINPKVVLTAAHCVHKSQANDLKIRAGEWDTQTTKERYPYQERNVAQIIIHEQFSEKAVYNDVALLILDRPLELAANVKTVCLPEQGQIFTQRECYVSGWGKKEFGKNGRPSVILKKIDLPMVPSDRCQQNLRNTRLGKFFNLHESFVCAGGELGKDACTGDGGSPLTCPDGRHENRYLQSGIVAWGIGCGEDKIPGVYANVALFRSWIDQHMQQFNLDISSYTH